MRILILEPDGFSGDALTILRRIGEVVFAPDYIHDAEAVFTRLAKGIDESVLNYYPRLKYIVSPTTGLDHIDLEAAEEFLARKLAEAVGG